MNSTLPRQPNTSSGSTSRPVQAERSTPSRGNKTFGSSMSSEEAEASGWVTVAKEVSADGVRQEGRKKDPKNAERCRASRQKRKALILQEKAVNASLKLQRTTLLKRIADLEQTVQELRGQNAVNLQKENELLAAEVQRYAECVERLVRTIKGSGVLKNAQMIESLKIGISGNVSRVVGLTYSSLADDSWKEGEKLVILGKHSCRVWYQYLPTESPTHEAQRLNLRVDVISINQKASDMIHAIKRANLSVQGTKDFYAGVQVCSNTKCDQLVSTCSSEEDYSHHEKQEISCWHLSYPKDEPRSAFLYACSSAQVLLFPAAYLYEKSSESKPDSLVPERATVIVNATTGIRSCGDKQKNIYCEDGSWFEGYVVRHSKQGPNTLSFIVSTPLDAEVLAFLYPYGSIFPSKEGQLTQPLIQFLEQLVAALSADLDNTRPKSEQSGC